MTHDDRGSTIPLILGFFVIALLAVAGSVALGDAFVQQREVQDRCDGAAVAAAASALDLRGEITDRALPFGDVDAALRAYLNRDPARARMHIVSSLSADRITLTLRCTERLPLAFGAVFGVPTVVHTVTSSAQAGVRPSRQ
jgi:hypothetical protein